MSDPVVDEIVAHLARVATHGVPAEARAAAKIFIADTLAVGIAGARAPWRAQVLDMAQGGLEEATAWGSGEKAAARRCGDGQRVPGSCSGIRPRA